MAKVNIGRFRFVYEGDYDPDKSYKYLSVVDHEGSSWWAITEVVPIGAIPRSNSTYWKEFQRGRDGKSLYELAVEYDNFEGTQQEFIDSMRGKDAYLIAIDEGVITPLVDRNEWIRSLYGQSAYDIAVEVQGFTGTKQEWLDSLRGKDGYTIPISSTLISPDHGVAASSYAVYVLNRKQVEVDDRLDDIEDAIERAQETADDKLTEEQVQEVIDSRLCDTSPRPLGVPSPGESIQVSRCDHVHQAPDPVPDAGPATATVNGTRGTIILAADIIDKGNRSYAMTAAGVNNHIDNRFDNVVPQASASVAAPGTTTQAARRDHVHPIQTTVSGNAGTATKLQVARSIALSGGATGTATEFDGTSNITIPVTALNMGNATAGTLAIARGGTGLTTSPSMLTNLATTAAANVLQASPRPGVTGVLPLANGGTGTTSLEGLQSLLGLTSGAGFMPTPHFGFYNNSGWNYSRNNYSNQNWHLYFQAPSGGTWFYILTGWNYGYNNASGTYISLGTASMFLSGVVAGGSTISQQYYSAQNGGAVASNGNNRYFGSANVLFWRVT